MIENTISRNKFLKLLAKISAIFYIGTKTIGCAAHGDIPRLKGISEDNYLSFHGIQKVFLEGNPIEDFDLGIALDNYVYGHPYPIETEDIILFLAGIPSSTLVALALDFSFTPLSKLDKDEMEKRLLSWKTSSLSMKRGLFSILRQFSFTLLSSDKKFQAFMGYNS
jgi:hypothetical protein